MIRFPLNLIICTICLTGFSFCKDVHQSPADVLCLPEESVTLTCNHSILNYRTILWYQRTHGETSLKRIGYVYYRTTKQIEKDYEDFTVDGDGESSASLQIPKAIQVPHSALYICAASYAQFHTRRLLKT
ncbi:uncharacterized protein LOC100538332 [Tachysurus ichikawai]